MKLRKFIYNKVTSTNDIAIKKIKSGITNGIIVANIQTKGRGRYGKHWQSFKENLFVTIFFELKNKINIKDFTLKNCIIIKALLKMIIKKEIIIKQPNDLIINKSKICGILQEILKINNKRIVLIGIGINISSSPYVNGYKTAFVNQYIKKKITKDVLFNFLKKSYENKLKYLI